MSKCDLLGSGISLKIRWRGLTSRPTAAPQNDRTRYVMLSETNRRQVKGRRSLLLMPRREGGRPKVKNLAGEDKTVLSTPRSNAVATWESRGWKGDCRIECTLSPKPRFSRRAFRTPQNDRAGLSSSHIVHNQILHFALLRS